jgi:hypothetical protein
MKAFEIANEKYQDWIYIDQEVKHHIHLTVPDSLLIKTINCKTSKLWKAICREHEGKTKIFRLEMARRIYNERCTDADDIRAHFMKMSKLREELAATGGVFDDENFTTILTNSLPESYSNVKYTAYTNATMNHKDPTIQEIIAVVEGEYSGAQSQVEAYLDRLLRSRFSRTSQSLNRRSRNRS